MCCQGMVFFVVGKIAEYFVVYIIPTLNDVTNFINIENAVFIFIVGYHWKSLEFLNVVSVRVVSCHENPEIFFNYFGKVDRSPGNRELFRTGMLYFWNYNWKNLKEA